MTFLVQREQSFCEVNFESNRSHLGQSMLGLRLATYRFAYWLRLTWRDMLEYNERLS